MSDQQQAQSDVGSFSIKQHTQDISPPANQSFAQENLPEIRFHSLMQTTESK